MAAVTTFQLAQQVHPIVSLEDIMGEWKSVIGSHASDWPCLKVVHKFDALFLGTEEVSFNPKKSVNVSWGKRFIVPNQII